MICRMKSRGASVSGVAAGLAAADEVDIGSEVHGESGNFQV
jgi:hypothetical protein